MIHQGPGAATSPNKAMKLTKLPPTPWPVGGAVGCPRRTISDAGTASQLIASVRPTWIEPSCVRRSERIRPTEGGARLRRDLDPLFFVAGWPGERPGPVACPMAKQFGEEQAVTNGGARPAVIRARSAVQEAHREAEAKERNQLALPWAGMLSRSVESWRMWSYDTSVGWSSIRRTVESW